MILVALEAMWNRMYEMYEGTNSATLSGQLALGSTRYNARFLHANSGITLVLTECKTHRV